MSTHENLSFSVENFSGKVRLFPLPNLVLFPHVMQPLHIFEPRYRDLLEDALKDDRLIAMAVLEPGWEADYEGRPPLYPIACLGRVASYHCLEDGTYNVLLLGVRRIRLIRELDAIGSFREAKAELCEDYCPPHLAAELGVLHRKLRTAFQKILPTMPGAEEQLGQLLGGDLSLGVLTDVIGYMLDIDIRQKEVLLAQTDVCLRSELLLKHLSAVSGSLQAAAASGFPPQFSAN